MEGCIIKAIYDFPKEAESDLTLNVGDIVKVTKQINDEWCIGIKGDQCGQFPTAFVKIALKEAPEKVYLGIADFDGEEAGDIRINKGDIIGLKEEVDEHWLVAKSDTSEGLCPKSFLKEIEFNEGESADDDIQSGAYGESIDSFNAQSGDELTFPKGVKIELVKEIDSFWTEGIFNGTKGKFPSQFVKAFIPLPPDLQFKENDSQQNGDGPGEATPSAKALYFYVGAGSDELSFDKGEIITLIEKVNKQWYKGQIGKSVGLFPANHVEVIVDLPFELHEDGNDGVTKQKDEDKNIDLHEGHAERLKKYNIEKTKDKPSLKPKPVVKPKPLETTNKTKPLLLKSSKQNQRNQPSKLSTENVESKVKFMRNEDKKLGTGEKEESKKTNQSRTVIRTKSAKKPNRPPTCNLSKTQTGVEDETKQKRIDHQDVKIKPILVGRPPKPKAIKHFGKSSALENDMPLLGSNKTTKKIEPKANIATETISPNIQLLESELSSLDLQTENADRTNSIFYVANEKQISVDKIIEESPIKERRKMKRPAPKRPDSHPSKETGSPLTKNPNGDSLCAKLAAKERPVKLSPTGSPSLSRIKENGQQPNGRKNMTLQPSLPKPLAPQPPKKPPVAPKSQKLNQNLMSEKVMQPSFQVYQSSDGEMTSSNNMSPFGKQESKTNGIQSSMFYVDYLANNSFDGKYENTDRQDIETVEEKIVFIKDQIESESQILSGIENLLMFSEDEDKRNELMSRQRTLSTSLMDLNEELFAYQDEKSYLLAFFGDVQAMKNRIDDLSKQIDSYKDNSAKLKRMTDIARVEELAEIKDGIEFCDNMVETLLDEIVSLKSKIEKEEECQKEDPVEVRRKLLNQRRNAIKELIQTEKDYHRDIDLCSKKILPKLRQSKAIDCEKLFGNLTEICSISSKLLEALGKLNVESDKEDGIGEKIGQIFAQICYELEKEYSNYCRNYDESQILLEKLEQDVEQRDEIFNAVTVLRDETGLWDLSSYLIKPVQRILKYPLILQEIHKFTPEDDPERESIQDAIKTLRNVATAINEFKRRKDLVQKYQKTEGIGNKIQRLNWHSVRKKSSRINQKITQFTGLVSQTVDENFLEEEKRFRFVEKLIKYFIRNIALYLELFQDSNNMQKIVAEDVKVLCAGAPNQDEIDSFFNVIIKLKDVICPKFVSSVKSRVFVPLDRLLQLFQSPIKLIEKRQDKCLDYDRMMNRVQKNKDADKSKQFNDELNMARNNYEALNSQLLEELPRLTAKCLQFIKTCLANFVEARRAYLSELTEELRLTLQFHLIERNSNAEIRQKHAESLFTSAEKISQLMFYPEKLTSYDGPMKADPVTLSRETFSNFYVDMLFEPTDNDPTSPIKPSTPDLNEARNNQQNEVRPIPLPRRRSLRRSSSSNSPSPTKSAGFSFENRTLETRRERQISVGESSPHSFEQSVELFVAEYSFEKEDAAEISIEEGTVVKVIRKHDKEANPEWWLVETSHGRGYVPSSYLRPFGRAASTRGYRSSESEADGKEDVDGYNQNGTTVGNGNCDCNAVKEMNSEKEKEMLNSANWNGDARSNKNIVANGLGNGLDVNVLQDNDMIYRALYEFESTEEEEASMEEGEIVRVVKIGDGSGNNEWCFIECKGKQGYVPFNYLEPVN